MTSRVPTKQQQAVILHTDGHAIVVAGPGAGKTATIVERVLNTKRKNSDARFCIVTFSRQAAEELKARLEKNGICLDKGEMVVGTFHSLALRCLRETGAFRRTSQILGSGAQSAFLRNAAASSGWSGSQRRAQETYERYSASWDAFLSPEEQLFVKDYFEVTSATESYDFSILLRSCVQGFVDKTIRFFPVDELIVDEAQDADGVQHKWIECFADRGLRVMLVADDDQAIYSFRGATGKPGLDRFVQRFQAKELLLEGNFRSAAEILTHSNKLISKNKNRFNKTSQSKTETTGKVEAHRFEDRDAELSKLVELVGKSPKSWAVLARTNDDLHRCDQVLARFGIPYWRPPGQSAFETQVGSAMISLLESLIRPQPSLAVCRALGVLQLLQLGEFPQDASRLPEDAMFGRLAAAIKDNERHGRAAAVRALSTKWRSWKDTASQVPDTAIIAVASWVKTRADHKDVKALECVTDLLCHRRGTLAERLNLRSGNHEREGVALLTFHASKGLEFDGCWIFGAADKAASPEEIEEERRLFYVAMTRARMRLVISCAAPDRPSKFIEEAGVRVTHYEPNPQPAGQAGPSTYSTLGRRVQSTFDRPMLRTAIPEALAGPIANQKLSMPKLGELGHRPPDPLGRDWFDWKRTSKVELVGFVQSSPTKPTGTNKPHKPRRKLQR